MVTGEREMEEQIGERKKYNSLHITVFNHVFLTPVGNDVSFIYGFHQKNIIIKWSDTMENFNESNEIMWTLT